ncbi:hypothetical protein [Streptomyces shenzhenensis]|uniref:hypothetical protein n=1 Tax=Streptomyces shenzhenensis TaxID=943815 RepID=UPI0015F0B869|nr:hypothetical protein [Streptomyces shenzhenensis]
MSIEVALRSQGTGGVRPVGQVDLLGLGRLEADDFRLDTGATDLDALVSRPPAPGRPGAPGTRSTSASNVREPL